MVVFFISIKVANFVIRAWPHTNMGVCHKLMNSQSFTFSIYDYSD